MNTSIIGASPIQNILLAQRMVRSESGFKFTASSLPGHLLHYVISGRVRQQCNNRVYNLQPGSVLWYHEDEWVVGEVIEAPWEFYSVNFIAPHLPPPRDDERLWHPALHLEEYFAALCSAWNNENLTVKARVFELHARLLSLLAKLEYSQAVMEASSLDSIAQLWWELETAIRRDLSTSISLKELETLSGSSAATVARASQAAVQTSPMRRVKQIRLSFARGLVQRSTLTLSEIAARVGYYRVHEFSRDYHRNFGCAPSVDRKTFSQNS